MTRKPERVLLVEGREDREFIYQLCNYHGLDNQGLFQVEVKDGYERLREDLTVRTKTGVQVIGVVVDADTDLDKRWDSVRDVLAVRGYTSVPEAPLPSGTIIQAGASRLPRIGIWLMPDNTLSGMMEDFVQRLVKEGDRMLPRAQEAVDSIPELERLFAEVHRTKATIHIWLAWQKEPGTPLGHSITRRYLDADHELAQRFMTWLKALFA